MIREIENRRSIRKYRSDEIDRKLIEEIIYSATLAPSAKNRQPWKFIVYQGEEKDKLVEVMRHGINSEKRTVPQRPQLNTKQNTPFASIEREKRIVETAVENMILTATGYGLGTLWIANTCFAYNELIEFIGTDNQLTGIVAVGAANEAPPKRPRKALRDVVEYR
ncbi:MAG: nitroreductase family protein [Lachnoclostridium sp.]